MKKVSNAEFYGWYFSDIYPKTQWHKWFAWRPVVVEGRRVWLRNIWREGLYAVNCYGDDKWKWSYAREKPEQMKRSA